MSSETLWLLIKALFCNKKYASNCSISGDFMPYNGGSSCDVVGYCRVEPHKDGFVLDIFYIIAEKYNFTLRHKHVPKWGTEGDLMEASAGTAIGDIISGEHPLSLSSCYTYPSRFELLDWCNMYVSIEHQFVMRNSLNETSLSPQSRLGEDEDASSDEFATQLLPTCSL